MASFVKKTSFVYIQGFVLLISILPLRPLLGQPDHVGRQLEVGVVDEVGDEVAERGELHVVGAALARPPPAASGLFSRVLSVRRRRDANALALELTLR